MNKRLLISLPVLVLVTFVSLGAQGINGKLVGTIIDPEGAIIPNAVVVIREVATNAERSVTSGGTGDYQFSEVKPGLYVVTVSFPGFRTQVITGVLIQIATTTTLNVDLKPGIQTESINVISDPGQVETQSSAVGGVISGRVTRDLPLNGRDFAQLTRLVAGATIDSEGGAAAFIVNGQRASANNFLVDGTDANNPFLQFNAAGPSGTSSAIAPVEAIQEFKVETQNSSAEFGRFSGAVVNVITRSGTNEFHGSVFEFFRNNVLDANNYFLNGSGIDRPALRNNQFGGVLGGPIRRDRTFFFGLFEGLRQAFSSVANGTVPSLEARRLADPALRLIISQIVLPNGPVDPKNPLIARFTSSAPSEVTEDDFTIRVDQRWSERDQMFVRYNYGGGIQNFASAAGGVAPNLVDRARIRLQGATINYTHTFSPNTLNEARVGWHRIANHGQIFPRSLFGAVPAPEHDGVPSVPLVIVSDLTLNSNIVGGYVGPSGNFFNTLQWIDNFTALRGRHSYKAGFDIRRVQLNRFNLGDNGGEGGVIVFSSTDALISNTPAAFINQVGNRHRGYRYSNFDFYGQNDFRVRSGLVLNFGIRYELNTVLSEVNDLLANVELPPTGGYRLTSPGSPPYEGDHNNFAPRFGLAYTPFRNGRLSLRGGVGIYYDLVTQVVANVLSNPPITLTNTLFLPGPYPDFLVDLPTKPGNQPPYGSAGMVPLKLRTPYSYQYNLTVQYQLTSDTMLQVGYVGSRGVRLLRSRVLNFILPFGPVPGINTSFSDPNFGLLQVNETSAQSSYNGLQVTVSRRASHGLTFLANYTYAHSIDDSSTLGLFGTSIIGTRSVSPYPSNPNDLHGERGNSNFDVRHVANVSYSWDIPFLRLFRGRWPLFTDGWSMNGVTTLRGGQPFTVAVGADYALLGDPTPFFSQRPNLIPNQPVTLGSRQGPNLRLNPGAFDFPAVGTFGNLGRNTMRGPDFSQFDFSLFKTTKLAERATLQLRVEVFNLFNHPNFALPTETANMGVARNSPDNFGVSNATVNTVNGQVGPVFAAGGPRNLQLALKVSF
ncbi:MAG: TonB-dependent receptor [Acidobacteria bacterium]|nr:TonB-dependent receptor [Acidobacteriota bacterium]